MILSKMIKKRLKQILVAIVLTFSFHAYSQEVKTKLDAINYLNSELTKRHSVAGWTHTNSDWFISIESTGENGFYDIKGYSLENEYLILKIRRESIVWENGRGRREHGKTYELLINLNDSIILTKKVDSKGKAFSFLSFGSYKVEHRHEDLIIDIRYTDKVMYRRDPFYKKNKNFDSDKIEELYKVINILKSNLNPDEKADLKLSKFKNEFEKNGALKEINEEQRKYIVQANASNEAKEYTNALLLYRKVLDVNKFAYPEAYFNMALILSHLEFYYQATYAMKAYLILVPQAEDARKAQDKIYEWELNIKP